MEGDILDLDNGTIHDLRRWNSVNQPAPMQRNGEFGMLSGTLLRKGKLAIKATMQKNTTRTTTRTVSRTLAQIGQSENVSAHTARAEREEVTLAQHAEGSPPNTTVDAGTLEHFPPILRQGMTTQSQAPSAEERPSLSFAAEVRHHQADPVHDPPIVSSTSPEANSVRQNFEDLPTFDLLTDAGRACFVSTVFRPPEQETCREYARVNNDIGASKARITTQRDLIEQHENEVTALKEAIATITAKFEKLASDITHKLTESNQALLSSTNPSDIAAYLASLNKATQKANAAQKEMSKMKSELTARTTELQNQMEGLKNQVEEERQDVQQAREEIARAETRKKDLEEAGGLGLAFAIGRQVERAAKRQRLQ